MLYVHMIFYGMVGLFAEVVWTAVYDAISGTTRAIGAASTRIPFAGKERWVLVGRTYLWMLPLYGCMTALLFEPLHEALRSSPLPLRGLAYAMGIFTLEAISGIFLRLVIGRCPWDYSHARTQVLGVIRLDYAPVWFGFGLLLERLHDLLVHLDSPLRIALGG